MSTSKKAIEPSEQRAKKRLTARDAKRRHVASFHTALTRVLARRSPTPEFVEVQRRARKEALGTGLAQYLF
jgi:hypothetical protein